MRLPGLLRYHLTVLGSLRWTPDIKAKIAACRYSSKFPKMAILHRAAVTLLHTGLKCCIMHYNAMNAVNEACIAKKCCGHSRFKMSTEGSRQEAMKIIHLFLIL